MLIIWAFFIEKVQFSKKQIFGFCSRFGFASWHAIILLMKITFMLFYYEPENPTTNYLYRPLWEKLLRDGHEINIITPNPTRGVSEAVQKEYKTKTRETHGKLNIYRVPCYTYKSKNYTKFKLLRRYISVSRRLVKQLKSVGSDVVFVSSSPPLLLSYLTTRYCTKRKIRVVYNVQDIYPNNLFKSRELMYKIFDPLQVLSLKKATSIITISETMRQTLLAKGDFNNKLNVIYNFDISEVKNHSLDRNTFFDKKSFNVVYAGNIGYVQDLDVVLAASKLVLHNPNICFHIIGEGSQAARIAKRISEENLLNVTYYPALSVEDCAQIYLEADINLISILPNIIKTALPLKTASVLEAGKEIIFIGPDKGEHQEEWLKEVKNLSFVPDRNYEKLANIIMKLYSDPRLLVGNEKALRAFNKEKFIENYVALILGN